MRIFKRFEYNAPVVLSFALVSLGAWFLNEFTRGTANSLVFSTYRAPFTDPLMYLRLFTHVLGHASLRHYTSNMVYILLLGPILEEKYGSKNLLEMILVTALVTAICNNLLFQTGLLGASGIVYMMIILASMTNFHKGRIPLTLIAVMAIFLGQEVYDGLFAADNISHLTHILGGICGCALGAVSRSGGKR